MPNGFAEVDALTRLLGAQGAFQSFGVGREAVREERAEERAVTRRGERFAKGRRQGGLWGGLGGSLLGKIIAPAALGALGLSTGGLGSLLIPALLSAAGSYKGQKVATRKARGKRIDPGVFFAEEGRERERLFREIAEESILGGALQTGATTFGLGAAFPGLFGGTEAAGVTFPGSIEQSLSRALGGRGAAPSSIEQSLAAILGGR